MTVWWWSTSVPEKSPLQEVADEVTRFVRTAAANATSGVGSSASSTPAKTATGEETAYDIVQKALKTPPVLITVTLLSTTVGYTAYRRYFRRIATAAYLTPSSMKYRRMIVGKCLSVGDADGFRLYHTPGPPIYRTLMYGNVRLNGGNGASTSRHNGEGSFQQRQTISVRLAGADAPESAHFGKPAQPFSKEAKEELERLVLNRQVWCQMAHIDQYQRLVATPYVWLSPYIFGRTNVSLRLVQRGLATVYTQSGAAYGTAGPFARFLRWFLGVDASKNAKEAKAKTALLDRLIPLSGEARLRRAEARAKRRKIGMWSQKNFVSPEEYKKKMKQQ